MKICARNSWQPLNAQPDPTWSRLLLVLSFAIASRFIGNLVLFTPLGH